ncbi:hypothetical protein [Shewanella maritima]|uniref:hypothetical protein n=1 Tax=Shewanella maritima TaxID=2520507 RepID=UPI0037362183
MLNKKLFKICAWLVVAVVIIYNGYFYVSPSITVENHSNASITESRIVLPSSGLDFGFIEAGSSNTLYYDLAQSDGQIRFTFTFDDGNEVQGRCGYVTSNELNQRTHVIIEQSKQVVCKL